MIRVAFIIEGAGFQGSVNYFRNLFSALALLSEQRLHPLLFVGTTTPDDVLHNFRHVEVVRSSLLDGRSLFARLRRLADRWSDRRDPMLRLLLKHHRVDVLSHFGPLQGSRIRTLAWIPDFQHLHLPAFFSSEERRLRDESFHRIANLCDRVLLSSEASQRDLAVFAPTGQAKSRVLRFIPEVDASAAVVPRADLERKYGFVAPYFYMPNQFWIHKNHGVVVDALAVLRSQGIAATVLMTGSTSDYRHPSYYEELMLKVEQLGLGDAFKVLGTVPYGDLLSLMQHALAVVNPSLFEGWSSSVEEAKALDKTVLLSNLPVHLEQNPAHGIFFDPADAAGLADRMRKLISAPAGAEQAEFVYTPGYAADRLRFAQRYQDIVVEAMSERQ